MLQADHHFPDFGKVEDLTQQFPAVGHPGLRGDFPTGHLTQLLCVLGGVNHVSIMAGNTGKGTTIRRAPWRIP